MGRLRRDLAAAARSFDSAAEIVMPYDPKAGGEYVVDADLAWYEHTRDKGDNTAMATLIARWEAALEERTRDRVPLDWVKTRFDMALALEEMGARTGEMRILRAEERSYAWAAEDFMTTEHHAAEWAAVGRARADEAVHDLDAGDVR